MTEETENYSNEPDQHSSGQQLNKLDSLVSIVAHRESLTIQKQYTRSCRLTTVYQEPIIVKEFFFNKKFKGEWQIEHDMIQLLRNAGIATPKSYGYQVDPEKASLYKEFVPGHLLTEFDADLLQRLAKMFAQIHYELVITRDAHDGNVIQTDAGELMFIDYGKSKQFNKRSLMYWATLVREHFFIKSKLLKENELFKVFLGYYLSTFKCRFPKVLGKVIKFGVAVLQKRDDLRSRRKYINP